MKRSILNLPAFGKRAFLMAALLSSTSALAQGQSISETEFLVYVVAGMVLITLLAVIATAVYVFRVVNLLTEQAARERAERLGVEYVKEPSIWQRISQKLTRATPIEKEEAILLDHSYDGIRELDNHLPPWWKWLFYGTIGWSVVYIILFHLSESLPLSLQEYESEIAQAEEQQRILKASQPETQIDENALVFTNDAALIENGKTVFMNNNCGSCHRNDGGGNTIGPNLTDDYWIHGGDVKDVFATIKNGAVEKGMPAWGKSMKPEDVRDLTFFVMSLKGTNPENAKAPQGELFKPPIPRDTINASVSLQK